MLAAIALCVATTILVKSGKLRYVWVTVLPLTWLVIITSSAAWEKLFSPELRIGFIAHANDLAAKLASGAVPLDEASKTSKLIFNDRLDAVLTMAFLIITWLIVFETARVSFAAARGRLKPPLAEAPYVQTQLTEI